jgi:hypothetical protein
MFACDAVDLDFLSTAPNRLGAVVKVGRPPSEVFAAFAHDPANWGEFFPGFDRTGSYHTSGPHGVGSRCTKRVTHVLRFVSTARLYRRFTPGLRTTTSSQTAATALCCALPSAASRDWPSNWPHLSCRAP